jgi:hypothetical protein
MLSIIASLIMSVAGCDGVLNDPDGVDSAPAEIQSKCLTSEQITDHELAQLIQAGKAGDTNSMARLEQYYLGRSNTVLARYWMERRAETGSAIAMHQLANLLLHQADFVGLWLSSASQPARREPA